VSYFTHHQKFCDWMAASLIADFKFPARISRKGPRVCRLAAGGKRIRTIGPARGKTVVPKREHPRAASRSLPGRPANDIGAGEASGSRRSDHSHTATAVGAAGETCGLNSDNLNILSEARIHAPELISDQLSVDPTEEVLCPSLVSGEVRR
jgi:hypothetical protein